MNHERGKQVSSSLLALSFVGFLATCIIYIVTKSSTLVVAGALICIAFVVAGIVLGLFVVRSRRKARTRELEAISKKLGWKFDSQPEQTNFLKEVPESLNTEFLGSVLEGKTQNLITGKTEAFDFAVFDQVYLHGVGADTREAVSTCILLKDKQLQLPVFRCEPRGWAHTIFKFLLSKETMFESHPKFSHRYRVHGPDEVALKQTFSPALLTYLEQTTPLTLVGAENYLIVLKEDAVFSPDGIMENLKKAVEMTKLL